MSAPNDESDSRQMILDEIREILACIGLDPTEVDPTANFVDDLDLDSLDWADLAMQLEDAFPIPLREERFASLRTVQDLVDRIYSELLETRNGAA
jgi:acyl carrier protein